MQQETIKPECRYCDPRGNCFDKIRETLSKTGGRLTSERVTLLKTICETKGHFQPHQILEPLKKKGVNISLTTVYRNLTLFLQSGIIRRASIQEDTLTGGVWYEHIWGREHHDHLICSVCGKKIEFSYPAIDILQEAVAKEYGYTLIRHHLELVGVCPDCQKNQ